MKTLADTLAKPSVKSATNGLQVPGAALRAFQRLSIFTALTSQRAARLYRGRPAQPNLTPS